MKQVSAIAIVTPATNAVALIVEMEDELLHTTDHPFCEDLDCPCHEVRDPYANIDPPYYFEYLESPYLNGLYSLDEVGRIFQGSHI